MPSAKGGTRRGFDGRVVSDSEDGGGNSHSVTPTERSRLAAVTAPGTALSSGALRAARTYLKMRRSSSSEPELY
jgi:hypothetical protein